ASASPKPPAENVGPHSVSLSETRPTPAPGERTPAALPPDVHTELAPAPSDDPNAADCPLAIPGVIVEAEGVPNGVALVFRAGDAEQAIRELTRRWYEELDRAAREREDETGVVARIGYSEAPEGAMVTFVPEDLLPDPERGQEDLNALRDGVERAAERMRSSRSCPLSAPEGVRLST